MKIKDIVIALEKFAPLPLQDSYDNAGLQVGLTEVDVSRVLLCLDVTEEILCEAIDLGCNLVVSHHPLLFRGLKRISNDTQVERCVRLAIKHDITLYAAHTNLDNVSGGVNSMIAAKIGLCDTRFLRPLSGTLPGGSGMIGDLPSPVVVQDFLHMIKASFGVETLMHNGLLNRAVSRVAICGGAGSFLLDDAIAAGADLFLTGEMSYHDYFGHEDEIQIAVIGHYQSEQCTIELLHNIIGGACPGVELFMTRHSTNPILYL